MTRPAYASRQSSLVASRKHSGREVHRGGEGFPEPLPLSISSGNVK
jgi:hypothetical protein